MSSGKPCTTFPLLLRAPCAAGLALPVTHLPVLAAAKQDTRDAATGNHTWPLGLLLRQKTLTETEGTVLAMATHPG